MPAPIVYPAPRERGAGGAAAPGAPPVFTPSVRIWPVQILESNGVAVAVSPQFNGPAVVAEIVFQMDFGAGVSMPTWTLYAAAENSGGGNNQALGTIPSGTRLIDNLTRQREDAFPSADLLGVPHYVIASGAGWQSWPLRLKVELGTFFLKLRLSNDSGATTAGMQGYVRVLENVPPEQLANFL